MRRRFLRARWPHPRLGSLKNKLALLFGGITALALAVTFFYVVPQLQSNLEDQQLRDLRRAAAASSRALGSVIDQEVPATVLDELVRAEADDAAAQLTLLGTQESAGGGIRLYAVSDSLARSDIRQTYALADRALRDGRPEAAIVTVGGVSMAQVARPLTLGGQVEWVALYSRSLRDVTETVSLIRTQVLVASAVALLVALAGGYWVARALARRVRGIEMAAREVAAGNFIDPLPVDSADELGQLTRAFNEMQEQLARVDRARREFIANASHELRTPLFSLGGFVELLQDEDLDQATHEEFLEAMREQVARLQKLAVDLLDLSRLDAGSMELRSERVDLCDLARTVVTEFRPAVSRHRTDLDVRLPGEGVEAVCDRERVAQIMRILLDNAIRHTPEGTRVSVTTDRRDGAAEFRVADSGPGVEPSSAAQLFERFYTADAASGSGLGLAIARELAERMDGQISLRSRPGSTVFTLALPAASDGGA